MNNFGVIKFDEKCDFAVSKLKTNCTVLQQQLDSFRERDKRKDHGGARDLIGFKSKGRRRSICYCCKKKRRSKFECPTCRKKGEE